MVREAKAGRFPAQRAVDGLRERWGATPYGAEGDGARRQLMYLAAQRRLRPSSCSSHTVPKNPEPKHWNCRYGTATTSLWKDRGSDSQELFLRSRRLLGAGQTFAHLPPRRAPPLLEGAFSWGVRVLFGPGRFGRMRRSPWRRWSSSHPCGRAIRRSPHPAHCEGEQSRR
jgi:hypothetical protein